MAQDEKASAMPSYAATPSIERQRSDEEKYVAEHLRHKEEEVVDLRKRLRLEEALTEIKRKIDELRWL